MATKASVEIFGFDEFLAGLEEMADSRINQAVKRAIRHAVRPVKKAISVNASRMVDHAPPGGIRKLTRKGHKIKVPYFPFGKTIIIKSGISRSGIRSKAGGAVWAVVGPTSYSAPHASLIEFGTTTARPIPVIRSAIASTKQKVLQRLTQNIDVQINHEWKKHAKKMNQAQLKKV